MCWFNRWLLFYRVLPFIRKLSLWEESRALLVVPLVSKKRPSRWDCSKAFQSPCQRSDWTTASCLLQKGICPSLERWQTSTLWKKKKQGNKNIYNIYIYTYKMKTKDRTGELNCHVIMSEYEKPTFNPVLSSFSLILSIFVIICLYFFFFFLKSVVFTKKRQTFPLHTV